MVALVQYVLPIILGCLIVQGRSVHNKCYGEKGFSLSGQIGPRSPKLIYKAEIRLVVSLKHICVPNKTDDGENGYASSPISIVVPYPISCDGNKLVVGLSRYEHAASGDDREPGFRIVRYGREFWECTIRIESVIIRNIDTYIAVHNPGRRGTTILEEQCNPHDVSWLAKFIKNEVAVRLLSDGSHYPRSLRPHYVLGRFKSRNSALFGRNRISMSSGETKLHYPRLLFVDARLNPGDYELDDGRGGQYPREDSHGIRARRIYLCGCLYVGGACLFLWAILYFDNKRRIWRASLAGLGLLVSSCGMATWWLWGFFPQFRMRGW
jgi:hypothetical protein